MKKHSFGPCVLESFEFGFIRDGVGEELTDRKNHRNETEEISKRDERRCLNSIRHVFLRRRVTKSDLMLIVEPIPIMRAQRNVDDPLHKTALDACFVLVIRRA